MDRLDVVGRIVFAALVVSVIAAVIVGTLSDRGDREMPQRRQQATAPAVTAPVWSPPPGPAVDHNIDPALLERLKVAAALRPMLGVANSTARVQATNDGDELVISTPAGDCDHRALVTFRRALVAIELDPADYGFVRMRCDPDGAALRLP